MSATVLFDARLVLEKPTGIGQYVVSLLPNLMRIAPDWHFHVIRRPQPWAGYGIDEWDAPNLSQHVSRDRHMSLRQHVTVPNLARRLGADLLHYPHFDAPVLLQRVPVVVTLYDVKYLVHPEFFPDLSSLKRRYMRFCFGQSLRRSAAVLTISESSRADLVRLFRVAENRVDVIPLAADPIFQPADSDAVGAFLSKYGLERPFVLTVGERRPHKNHARLIRAFARSRSRETHDLVIVGQPYRDYGEPEREVGRAELEGRVHFLAGVAVDELAPAYTAAEAFVLLSLYEGFGLPILEAMGCETPVVASKTTALGEVLGEAGVAVDPEDEGAIAHAIDQVLRDEEARRRLLERAANRRADFSWQTAAERTLAVYRRVLDLDV
jgi:glycosyltransferase involved in cell wall biosynthesis